MKLEKTTKCPKCRKELVRKEMRAYDVIGAAEVTVHCPNKKCLYLGADIYKLVLEKHVSYSG